MTRKAQFLARRQKYTNKMIRYMKTKGSSVFVEGTFPPGVWRKKQEWVVPVTGKQLGKRIRQETDAAEPPHLLHSPPFVIVTGGGYGNPPHQHVDPALTGPGVPGAAELRSMAAYGGHQRRRKYIGRKPGRLTGPQRKLYFAALCHFLNGYWPDWDPLTRTPSESQVNLGTHPPDPDGSWV